MMSARMSTLVTLRGRIERLETHDGAYATGRVALGHEEVDSALQGGLALGAVHEVFAEGSRHSAGATGFVLGLTARALRQRPLLWIAADFGEREMGALSMSGLSELGLDPRCLVTVRASDVESALRTAADALACDALGAVVLEVWGETRHLNLVTSRKLTLAAQASRVTGFVLRMAATPQASTAETRWIVRAAHSPPAASSMPAAPWSAWGAPVFDAQLVRNRHGPIGRWTMEWKSDECLFADPAADPQPVAATPAHRSHQARALHQQRRAS
jgi:protein ImuA